MWKKSLQKSMVDFSSAIEQGHAAVYRRNFDSDTYEYMGDYIKDITGYGPDELTPKIWDSLLIRAEAKGDLEGRPLEECYRLNRTGQVGQWQADMQIRTRAGQTRWVTDMSTVLRDDSGVCFGCLGVLLDITDRKEAEKQLADLTEKLRLRNQEMELELSMAREVQQALVVNQPKQFPSDAANGPVRLNFFFRYIPAEMLAGDFFEIIPLSDHEVGVFICDVVGHGVRAALLTTFLRGLTEELMPKNKDPGSLFCKINQSLRSVFGKAESLLFATAAYMVIDVETGQIRYANAGHPKPLSLRSGIKDCPPSSLDGLNNEPALGIIDNFEYSTSEYALSEGETMLLYTDGLFEAYNEADEMYGEERLAEYIQRQYQDLKPDSLLDEVLQEVRHHTGSDIFEDDVCLLAVVPAPTAC
jgi:sigma-B regulation protein RsbU (phosphoserine phosphatase)